MCIHYAHEMCMNVYCTLQALHRNTFTYMVGQWLKKRFVLCMVACCIIFVYDAVCVCLNAYIQYTSRKMYINR